MLTLMKEAVYMLLWSWMITSITVLLFKNVIIVCMSVSKT